jgi:hypothetical protein
VALQTSNHKPCHACMCMFLAYSLVVVSYWRRCNRLKSTHPSTIQPPKSHTREPRHLKSSASRKRIVLRRTRLIVKHGIDEFWRRTIIVCQTHERRIYKSHCQSKTYQHVEASTYHSDHTAAIHIPSTLPWSLWQKPPTHPSCTSTSHPR